MHRMEQGKVAADSDFLVLRVAPSEFTAPCVIDDREVCSIFF